MAGKRNFDNITTVLRELNWLPVSSILSISDCLLTLQCLRGSAPEYQITSAGNSASAADKSLAVFSAMNEWQRVLFLKRESSQLLLVSKMFV